MTITPHTVNPELDLVIERELPVSPDPVWRAWTDAELLKQFFAPKPFETPRAELDVRPGGRFFSVMRSPDGDEFENEGCYLEVVENSKLVWTTVMAAGYRPVTSPMPFTAVLELEPTADGGTRYRAVAIHQEAAGKEQHEAMGFHEGWGQVIDQMVELMQAQ